MPPGHVLADREHFTFDDSALTEWEAVNARPARDLPGYADCHSALSVHRVTSSYPPPGRSLLLVVSVSTLPIRQELSTYLRRFGIGIQGASHSGTIRE